MKSSEYGSSQHSRRIGGGGGGGGQGGFWLAGVVSINNQRCASTNRRPDIKADMQMKACRRLQQNERKDKKRLDLWAL